MQEQQPQPVTPTHPYPNNITRFLAHLSKLTPEERAEWDRRVGYFVEEIEFLRSLETR